MEILIDLERDSHNSYPGKVKVEIVGLNGQPPSVLFTLDGGREFQVDLRGLKRALAALEDES